MDNETICVGLIAFTSDYIDGNNYIYGDKYEACFVAARSLPYFQDGSGQKLGKMWKDFQDDTEMTLDKFLAIMRDLQPKQMQEKIFNVCFDLVEGDKTKDVLNDVWLKMLMKNFDIDDNYAILRYKELNELRHPSYFKKYFSQKNGFSIEFPDKWQILEDIDAFVKVKAISPDFINTIELYSESISIIIENVGSVSLEDYYNTSLLNVQKSVEKFLLLENGDLNIDNIPAKWLKYSFSHPDGGELYTKNFILTKNNLAYTIACFAVENSYHDFEEIFNHVGLSIKVFSF